MAEKGNKAGMTSVLRRKLAGIRDGAAVTDRSAMRALRLGLARAAGETLDLPLAVIGASHSRLLQPDAVKRLDDNCLIVVLDGRSGGRGAVQIDAALSAAIVQQQTIGSISAKGPDEEDRRPTATDAALAAPLLDDALARAERLVEVAADRDCIAGYRFGAQAENARSLGLALVADRYRVFDLSIDMGAGLRKGLMTLILPEPEPEVQPVAAIEAIPEPPPSNPMLDLPTQLDAVLATVKLPLVHVGRWKSGDLLPLPIGTDLARTRLVSASGEEIAVCQLGQVRGAKALRMPAEPVPEPSVIETEAASFEELERMKSGLNPMGSLEDAPADGLDMMDSPMGTEPEFGGGLDGGFDAGLEGGFDAGLEDGFDAGLAGDLGDGLHSGLSEAAGDLGGEGDGLGELSPEEAALEISELAGLPATLDDFGTDPVA